MNALSHREGEEIEEEAFRKSNNHGPFQLPGFPGSGSVSLGEAVGEAACAFSDPRLDQRTGAAAVAAFGGLRLTLSGQDSRPFCDGAPGRARERLGEYRLAWKRVERVRGCQHIDLAGWKLAAMRLPPSHKAAIRIRHGRKCGQLFSVGGQCTFRARRGRRPAVKQARRR